MKQNKKKKNVVIRTVLLLVLAAVIITGCIFSHFGGFGTGPCADTEKIYTFYLKERKKHGKKIY